MTPAQRGWLASIRRASREAALDLEFGRYDVAFMRLHKCFHDEVSENEAIIEVRNMVASLITADRDELQKRPAMQAAAMRRLDEIKQFISDSLIDPHWLRGRGLPR